MPTVIIDYLHSQYDHAMSLYYELQNPSAASAQPPVVTPVVAPSADEPHRAPVIDIAAARADSKAEVRGEPQRSAVVSPLSAIGGEQREDVAGDVPSRTMQRVQAALRLIEDEER